MATVTMSQEQNYIVYNRQMSTESGWENPFRPGGDLSREADEIVELIKSGKPVTPTPDNTSPKLLLDESDNAHSPNEVANTKTANDICHESPMEKQSYNNNQQNHNGNTYEKSSIGAVEVQRVTLIQPSDASQIEHIVIKKKSKCKCCVIQ